MIANSLVEQLSSFPGTPEETHLIPSIFFKAYSSYKGSMMYKGGIIYASKSPVLKHGVCYG